MRLFLESLDLSPEAKQALLQHNDALFERLVTAGVLREIAPRLPDGDRMGVLET